jgi:hypothetical protein
MGVWGWLTDFSQGQLPPGVLTLSDPRSLKHVSVKLYNTTSVLGAVDVPYSDWGVQSVKLSIEACDICMINKETSGACIDEGSALETPSGICQLNSKIEYNGLIALF